MNIDQLKAAGAIVSSQPIVKDVTWTRTVDGEEKSDTYTIKVRRRSYRDVCFFAKNRETQDQQEIVAHYLAHFLVNDDNKSCFTIDEILSFKVSFIDFLAKEVQEIVKEEVELKN